MVLHDWPDTDIRPKGAAPRVDALIMVTETDQATEKSPTKARSRWLGSSFTVRPVPRFDAKASIVANKAREQFGWRNGARVRRVK